MGIVDFILNLAGLLLWIKWRSLPFDPIHKRTPATLVGTLRRAAPSPFRRWHLLVVIALLLLSRAGLYRLLGPAISWKAPLNLLVTMPLFQSKIFGQMLLFSFFSFAQALGGFYFCLLLLSLLNEKSAAPGPIHQLVRMPLGGIDLWPRWAKIILPFAGTALVWWLASWLLAWQKIIPQPVSAMHRIEQSLVLGLGSYLAWKLVVAALLVLHLLNNYIYFGRFPLWHYVNATAQTLLSPFRKIPLRAGRVDFAPVVGIAFIFFAAELAEHGLVWLYTRLPF